MLKQSHIRQGVMAIVLGVAALLVFDRTSSHQRAQAKAPEVVSGVRLYIFDLGAVSIAPDLKLKLWDKPFDFEPNACCSIIGQLIVHPRGTLMWDTGLIPDDQRNSNSAGVTPSSGKPLRTQLTEVGYPPENVTYIAFSHWHSDHAANANLFRRSTWIVQEPERKVMLAALEGQDPAKMSPPMLFAVPSQYDALKFNPTIVLSNLEEYDVFGDGTVVIKSAPGHTAGHQVLVLKLPKRGRVLLGGDLYHLREERAAQAVPTTALEYDREQSRASRQKIEAYLKKTNIPLWLSHDSRLYASLKKAPHYVE